MYFPSRTYSYPYAEQIPKINAKSPFSSCHLKNSQFQNVNEMILFPFTDKVNHTQSSQQKSINFQQKSHYHLAVSLFPRGMHAPSWLPIDTSVCPFFFCSKEKQQIPFHGKTHTMASSSERIFPLLSTWSSFPAKIPTPFSGYDDSKIRLWKKKEFSKIIGPKPHQYGVPRKWHFWPCHIFLYLNKISSPFVSSPARPQIYTWRIKYAFDSGEGAWAAAVMKVRAVDKRRRRDTGKCTFFGDFFFRNPKGAFCTNLRKRWWGYAYRPQ